MTINKIEEAIKLLDKVSNVNPNSQVSIDLKSIIDNLWNVYYLAREDEVDK